MNCLAVSSMLLSPGHLCLFCVVMFITKFLLLTIITMSAVHNAGDRIDIHGFWSGKSDVHSHLSLPPDLTESKLRKVACSSSLLLVLTQNGELFKKSLNDDNAEWQLVRPGMHGQEGKLNFVDIATNDHTVLALDNHGTLCVPPERIEVPGVRFTQVSCGKEHFIALSDTGVVYTWGSGSRGQLGNGSLSSVGHPEPVSLLEGLEVIQVAAGGWHNCVVSSTGDLYVWGWNESGQLGLPCRAVREKDAGLKNETVDHVSVQADPCLLDRGAPFETGSVSVKSVSCGSRHTAAVFEDGTGWTWGWNGHGQLGIGDLEPRDTAVRVLDAADRVSCGPWHTLWITHK